MQMNRRQFLKVSGACGAASALSIAGGYGYSTRLETEWLSVERVRIPLASLKSGLDGFTIVHLSDFHLFPHTRIEFIREAVVVANRLAPDLIALTGDFVLDDVESIHELAPVISGLNARHGVFSVLGNHDLWKGPRTVTNALEKAGIPVLTNRGVLLECNGQGLFVAGVDDAWSGKPDLTEALEGRPGGVPVVLLSHEPDPADQYCSDGRISLQLSGHSHGGQIRIPGLGAPYLPPLARKYELGLYRVGDSWLYTNRGIGVTVPFRFNCRPEITEFTLVAV